MFIPFGDDVEKNSAPFVCLIIITFNVIIAVFTSDVMYGDETGEATMAYFMQWGIVPGELGASNCYQLGTHMFLHGGFMHLFGNMLMLWALGPTLEELLGYGKFLTLYVLSGFAAVAVYYGMNMDSTIPCVGASGAISGVIGAYCYSCGADTRIRTLMLLGRFTREVKIPSAVYAVMYMLTQYWGFISSPENVGGVAFSAHMGGFAGGMLLMAVLQDKNKQVIDAGGYKRIRTNGVFEEYEEVGVLEPAVDESGERLPLGMTCTYCESELTWDHEIAPKLFRCPNSECGHMNLDTSGIPEKKLRTKQYI